MNEEKLHDLLVKMVTELGAAVMGVQVIIGDKLGLYKALAANGGLTAIVFSVARRNSFVPDTAPT